MGSVVKTDSVVNSTSSVDAPSVYTFDKTRKVTIEYLVIDRKGDGDDVRYKRWSDAIESVLDEKGVGDELIAEMRSCCVNTRDGIEVADWLTTNSEFVKEKLSEHGYRVLEVLV